MNTPLDRSTTLPRSPLSEILSDAIRYWELRRIFYNLILVAVTVGYAAAFWRTRVTAPRPADVLPLFVLAVLANVCYCAAYLVDIPVQYSAFQKRWRRWRGILWLIGTLFASTLAVYWLGNEVLPFVIA